MSIVKETEKFELKHKIISLIGIIILTIGVTRLLTWINDPNLIIHGYELHHFYYGVILLLMTSIFMLFGKKHLRVYLTLTAISAGLIIDEFLYVAGGFGNTQKYMSTLPSALVFTTIILAIVLIVYYFFGKHKK